MALVAAEPLPRLATTFTRSLLRLRFGDARATLGAAWRLAFQRSRPVVPLVRMQSILLVLLLAVILGAAGALAAGGTLRVIEEIQRSGSDQQHGPAVMDIGPTPSPDVGGARPLGPTAVPEAAERMRQGGRTGGGAQDAAGREDGAEGQVGAPQRRQQGDGSEGGSQQGGQQGTSPRDGVSGQGTGRRQTPAPDGRRSQATAAPGGGPGPAEASPRVRDGSRIGG